MHKAFGNIQRGVGVRHKRRKMLIQDRLYPITFNTLGDASLC
jgi:hypothetical protein